MKKYKLLLIAILSIILPMQVKANPEPVLGSINVECQTTNIKPGDETTCTISGNAQVEIKQIDATINLSNNLELSSNELTLQEGWSGKTINNSAFSITTTSKTGTFTIGQFKIKAKESAENGNATITITKVEFINKSDTKMDDIDDAETNIQITKEEQKKTGLSSLTITNGSLLGIFDPNTKSYTATIDTDTFGINAIPANQQDKVTIINTDNNQELTPNSIAFSPKSGSTTMSIEIQVGSGETQVTYTLLVSKKQNETTEDKKYLSSLVIGGKTISITEGKYDYEVTLKDIESYTIKAVLEKSDKYIIEDIDGNKDKNGTYEKSSKEDKVSLLIKEKDTGVIAATYSVTVKKTNTPTNPSTNNNQTITSNPQTGSIPMFVMFFILLVSLIISLNLYRKNLENYNQK